MKLLRVTAQGLPLFKEKLDLPFYAQQRVAEEGKINLYSLFSNIYLNPYKYNVLEELVIKNIESNKALEGGNRKEYFIIKNDIQERFKNDFYCVLQNK